ncbi:hypothetical protein AVEN_89238-1 [Araneus ventricosus]|uniref:Integrase zinc-binding domain-containing protein n=1 Tax=Araneus ventricosus TaxID=182803 RepID=A0A4Y2L2T5_ARAVE|nr:hypothetical protein AVEN_89238-1 [Araneus ventricosus]
MRTKVVKNIHSEDHFFINKTENLVKQSFYFPNMRKCVVNLISNCIECILVNKKRRKDEGFLNPLPKEKRGNYNKKRRKARHYKVRDFVAIQRTQFGTGLKLRPKFFGPYEMIKSR